MHINKNNKLKRLSYLWEKNRLDSFKIWPFNDKSPCSKKRLAEAGFFWTGTSKNPDSAQCFVCEKQLDGWEAEDNPWEEHIRHSSSCIFAKLNKKESDLTYGQLYDIYTQMAEKILKKDAENRIQIVTRKYEAINKKFEEAIDGIDNL